MATVNVAPSSERQINITLNETEADVLRKILNNIFSLPDSLMEMVEDIEDARLKPTTLYTVEEYNNSFRVRLVRDDEW